MRLKCAVATTSIKSGTVLTRGITPADDTGTERSGVADFINARPSLWLFS